jgi:hypothetical protein
LSARFGLQPRSSAFQLSVLAELLTSRPQAEAC